jgi:carboxyl-terminal processing protease
VKDSRNYIFANNKVKRRGIIGPIIFGIGIFLLAGVISIISFLAGNYAATRGMFLVKTPSEQVKSTAEQLNDKSKYSALFQVRDKLIEKFDGDVDDNKLLEGAIKGMTNSLDDKYTVFMNKEEFDALMKESSGAITGIGVTITSKDNKLTIIDTVKDAPADRAGVIANDVIEKINDTELSGDDVVEKAIGIIAAAKGSELKFTIKRADVDSFEVNIVPEKVKIKSVEGSMINSNVGYIRIKTFMNENTTEDFKTVIEELRAHFRGWQTQSVPTSRWFPACSCSGRR